MSIWSWLADPFGYDFMVRATIATLAVCMAAPMCGIWALSRRLVYLTDAMSHGILAGMAGASIIGGSLLVGGLVAGVTMALIVSVLVVRARMPEDGAIGVVGQGLFALGVIGVSLQSDPRALAHILFGNPLTVTRTDVVIDAGLAVLVVLAVTALRPELLATTFDAVHATHCRHSRRTAGRPDRGDHCRRPGCGCGTVGAPRARVPPHRAACGQPR